MDVQDIIKSLRKMNETAKEDRPRLSEAEFTKYLLPLLVDYHNAGDVNLQVWAEIAGNPHRAIDVFDIKNELLFTVPPVLARVPSMDRPLGATTTAVSELAYLYGEKSRSEHPAVADAWLDTVMKNQVIPADQEQILEHMRQWIKIYRRYNLPIERLIGNKDELAKLAGEDTKGSSETEPDISGVFDDF